MLVALYIRNAFNLLEWGIIIRKLKARSCAKALVRLISSYLSERRVTAKTTEEMKTVEGVPPGFDHLPPIPLERRIRPAIEAGTPTRSDEHRIC